MKYVAQTRVCKRSDSGTSKHPLRSSARDSAKCRRREKDEVPQRWQQGEHATAKSAGIPCSWKSSFCSRTADVVCYSLKCVFCWHSRSSSWMSSATSRSCSCSRQGTRLQDQSAHDFSLQAAFQQKSQLEHQAQQCAAMPLHGISSALAALAGQHLDHGIQAAANAGGRRDLIDAQLPSIVTRARCAPATTKSTIPAEAEDVPDECEAQQRHRSHVPTFQSSKDAAEADGSRTGAASRWTGTSSVRALSRAA